MRLQKYDPKSCGIVQGLHIFYSPERLYSSSRTSLQADLSLYRTQMPQVHIMTLPSLDYNNTLEVLVGQWNVLPLGSFSKKYPGGTFCSTDHFESK